MNSQICWLSFYDSTVRENAAQEFQQRTGGGIDGANWMALLCDYEPPINFRWPEYVTTARGTDWWIPASMPDA